MDVDIKGFFDNIDHRWLMRTRKIAKELRGRIYLIRYCDDLVIGCTNREDAHEVWQKLQVYNLKGQ